MGFGLSLVKSVARRTFSSVLLRLLDPLSTRDGCTASFVSAWFSAAALLGGFFFSTALLLGLTFEAAVLSSGFVEAALPLESVLRLAFELVLDLPELPPAGAPCSCTPPLPLEYDVYERGFGAKASSSQACPRDTAAGSRSCSVHG